MSGAQFKLWLGGALVLTIALAAIFAPLLAPHDPFQQDLMRRLRPPAWEAKGSLANLLGTDNYGRDLLSRLIFGSRVSILVGVAAMAIACVLGSALGLLAGFKGGKLEQIVMRAADTHLAFPEVLLAVLIVAAVGGSVLNLVLVLGISGWMAYARVTYAQTRSLKERPFVEAARSFGARDVAIIWLHILPQLVPVLTVLSTLQVARMILQETALSFLGLGVPPPAPTWGNILAEGRDRLLIAPWIANLAGIAIILLVWGINMFGNGLRDRLDPRSRPVG